MLNITNALKVVFFPLRLTSSFFNPRMEIRNANTKGNLKNSRSIRVTF